MDFSRCDIRMCAVWYACHRGRVGKASRADMRQLWIQSIQKGSRSNS